MRILLTLPRPLFPADLGGKIRTLNIFSRLADRLEIHAVSLADRERDADAVAEMRRLFRSYTPVYWRETPKFTPRFYVDFARSRLSRFPYFVEKYRRPELRATAEQVAAQQECDLLLCDFLQSAAAMLESPLRPRVVFQHNVEYVIRRRHWEVESNPLRKSLLAAEWRKARAVECQVCREFDRVLAVSEVDAQHMLQEFGVEHVSVLPTGVDTEYFQPQDVEPRRGNMVFVGSMDWQPNEDGINWFVGEVFPLIQQRASHASLSVVGRNPSARVRSLAVPGVIEITGTVEDVRPYLARAELVVVPLRIGGGTRIKIFEAMAMGRPVVSTTLGAEGLPVTAAKDIILADDAKAFADQVVQLLTDSECRERIAQSGLEVARHHSWGSAAERMEVLLKETLRYRSVTATNRVATVVG